MIDVQKGLVRVDDRVLLRLRRVARVEEGRDGRWQRDAIALDHDLIVRRLCARSRDVRAKHQFEVALARPSALPPDHVRDGSAYKGIRAACNPWINALLIRTTTKQSNAIAVVSVRAAHRKALRL